LDAQGEAPLLTARALVEWRRKRAGLEAQRLSAEAVLTHQGYLLPRRRAWERRRSIGGFSFDLRIVSGGGLAIAGVRGVGAPGSAIAIEELAAAGVRRLIAVDICGSLVAEVVSGDVVVVERALACDGTSRHYAGTSEVRADEGLTRRLQERLRADGVGFTTGTAWSTDAVYRETPSELDAARGRGAVVADMETGCVFAVAATLGIEAAAVLVAADELSGGWRPPGDMKGIEATVRRAYAAASACLLS
jgi:uridine phosphorylase